MILTEAKPRTAVETEPFLPSANDLIAAPKNGVASERRNYQRQVAALLQAINQRVARLERLRARGLRGRALTEPATELSVARHELAELIRGRQHEPRTVSTASAAVEA